MGIFDAMAGKAWAKLGRQGNAGGTGGAFDHWHSLEAHAIDVAAVFASLIALPGYARRLDLLARRGLDERDRTRLAVLVFLHDLGKANAWFQARALPFEERRARHLMTAGHIREVAGLFAEVHQARTLEALPMRVLFDWFAGDEERFWDAFLAILSHHGRPLPFDKFKRSAGGHVPCWRPVEDYDPFRALARLSEVARRGFASAFEAGGLPLPRSEPFWHAIAGLTQLADWIGSHEGWFPLCNGDDHGRGVFAHDQAAKALAGIGLDVAGHRARLAAPRFNELFVDEHGRGLTPRALQRAAAGSDLGPVVLIEAETGSGKTEAALWRFAGLFHAGEVDALYFALPTRVAASQIYDRVRAMAGRLFGPDAPPVVLAVPGQARLDGTPIARADPRDDLLPRPETLWTDDADDPTSHRRWAGERPKRFLAAAIAVGTIDQALLSGLEVKHAHLRHASLMRSLLVVDEVHASDVYMTRLTEQLLANHRAAGGHALLMSATLGSEARTRLLAPLTQPDLPARNEAVGLAYPALWSGSRLIPQSGTGKVKHVHLESSAIIDRPDAIAEMAAAHLAAGAKILIIRNTVKTAQATSRALEDQLGADHPALFRCQGIASLHHGRFAKPDRLLLDRAVEEQIGKVRPDGPLVIVGSQTLEQSLDIDADLLITDLCPVDVLLQRIGRLHRHDRTGDRPAGYETARTIVLVPSERSLIRAGGKHGLGPFRRKSGYEGGVYENLFAIEETWRLIEQRPQWVVPEMNRELVERATHPETAETLLGALEGSDPAWQTIATYLFGADMARGQQALAHTLKTSQPFANLAFPEEEKVLTRLGANDRLVPVPEAPTGPFGLALEELIIPGWWAWAKGLAAEVTARVVPREGGQVLLIIEDKRVLYDRFGLQEAP